MPKSLITLLFFCVTFFAFAQKNQQQKLEIKKANLQKEIRNNEIQLKNAKKKEQSASKIIAIQNQKIKLKTDLIATTEQQTQVLSDTIQANELKISHLDNELHLLKSDYAEMILKSYKSRSYESRLLFILASNSFLQAYKRVQYMQQYASYRRFQGREIEQKSKQLLGYHQNLTQQKRQKENLIAENQKEKVSLETEKQEQQKIVQQLQNEQKKYIAEIKKKQLEYKKIDKEIDRLIRLAIAEANRKAALARAAKEKALREKALAEKRAKEKALAEKAKANALANASKPTKVPVVTKEKEVTTTVKKPVSTTKMDLTPGDQIISDNFKANKGRLPWPVDKGSIFIGFGTQPHPVYKTLTIQNSGLSIATYNGATARAVFSGEVFSVIAIANNKAVMIQHGDYFTVYQNLSSIQVRKGDKVSTKQPIGTVRTNGEGKTILKFTLCQNVNYINPKPWLSAK